MGPITGNRFGRGTITMNYDTAGLGGPPPAVGVTPTVWDEGPDWLIDAFQDLREFYAAAGQAVADGDRTISAATTG